MEQPSSALASAAPAAAEDRVKLAVDLALDEDSLGSLYGHRDDNLRRIERTFQVQIGARGPRLSIEGGRASAAVVEKLLLSLAELSAQGVRLRTGDVRTATRVLQEDPKASLQDFFRPSGLLASVQRVITPRTLRQQLYMKAMVEHDIVLSIGPAGTGKTYLAVAVAAACLLEKTVRRIVLARPAVEAGEKLGFLPGDLVEKVNPFLRPLYDSLYDIIGYEKVGRMIERGIIEVAPIAFMRGRTLNESFVILDEAQNTTSEQMKMFLTRIGFGSKAVINGDITQVDLPETRRSGLLQAQDVLRGVEGIAFQHFDQRDVVRHPLVQKVVNAYERYDERRRAQQEARKKSAAGES
ncbi:MAG: PhoH family protein [Acidobacteriota bacterium]